MWTGTGPDRTGPERPVAGTGSIYVGDSFADLFFKDYFHRHFHDVKYIFAGGSITSPLEKGIVPEYQPDVVIFETVERYWTIISA